MRVGRERTRGERENVAWRKFDGVTHTSKHFLCKLTCGYLSTTEIRLLYVKLTSGYLNSDVIVSCVVV